MARNRKRRSEGRPRRPNDGPGSEPGIATARGSRRNDSEDALRDQTPDALEHGTPDVELAEAQLALGRPELTDQPPSDDELLEEAMDAGGAGSGRGGRIGRRGGGAGGGGGGGDSESSGGSLAPTPAAAPVRAGSRLIQFLQGSWRELQRVQWPDRRQVMQATGVVIGFVIVAGVFLGVADVIASRVVNLLIK